MKKVFAFALILMSFLIISCSKKQEPAYLTTVRLVTDNTSVFDGGFNESAWLGILDFHKEDMLLKKGLGTAYDVFPARDNETHEDVVLRASEEKPSLIIAVGFAFERAIANAAKQYPDQKYLIVDINHLGVLPNLMQAAFAEHEGSYLVGVAAAEKALEDKVNNPAFGFIGGMDTPVIGKFKEGYFQGIVSVIPDARLVEFYTNDWEALDAAQEKAREWYNTGVYTIFAAAGLSGNGMIEEAKSQRQRGRNVWAVGVDVDQYELGKYTESDSAVLTSMLKKVDTAVIYALNAVEDNSFKGEIVTFGLKNDGVGYSAKNPALTSAIIEKVELVRQQILNGTTIVYSSY